MKVNDQTVDHAAEATRWLEAVGSGPGPALKLGHALVHAVLALGQQGARPSTSAPVVGPHGHRHLEEPTAPAIVRHAGVHLVRPLGLRVDDEWQWLLIDQPRRDGETGCQWRSWATVLELDPLVEPEIILFGGGE